MADAVMANTKTSPTVEMPLTEDMRAAIRAEAAGDSKKLTWMALGALVIGVGIGALVDMLLILGAVGLGIAAIFFVVGKMQEGKAGKDLQAGVFLRTTGAWQVVKVEHKASANVDDNSTITTCDLVLADRRIRVKESVAKVLGNVSGGVVDYTKETHVVLEARDTDGKVVYRNPKLQK